MHTQRISKTALALRLSQKRLVQRGPSTNFTKLYRPLSTSTLSRPPTSFTPTRSIPRPTSTISVRSTRSMASAATPPAGAGNPASIVLPPGTKPAEPTCTTLSSAPGEPTVYSFFEPATSTWQYLVVDPSTTTTTETRKAVIIDPVLDYNPASGQISTQTADGLLAFVKEHNLEITMLLETHAHADHLTSAQYLKRMLGGNVPVAIGKRIKSVQERFAPIYGVDVELYQDAFDHLWTDDESFSLGSLEFTIMHLPGHTPDHVGYKVGKCLFVGDTLFYPDVGSARADFPGGSPTDLYHSIERLLSLSPDTKIYAGHDYPPQGEQVGMRCWSFVSEQKDRNVHVGEVTGYKSVEELRKGGVGLGKEAKLGGGTPELSTTTAGEANEGGVMNRFIEWRANRDKTLGAPRLLHPSLQVNICAGRLPRPDANGRRTLRIPLKGIPEGL